MDQAHTEQAGEYQVKPFPPTTTNPETSTSSTRTRTTRGRPHTTNYATTITKKQQHHRTYLQKKLRKKHVGPACVQPGTNRLVDARVTAQRAKIQKNKLRSVKAMVDSGPPKVLKLVKWRKQCGNPKKRLNNYFRELEIERLNRLLIHRILDVDGSQWKIRKKTFYSNTPKLRPNRHGLRYKTKIVNLMNENHKLLHKIMNAKSEFTKTDWEKDILEQTGRLNALNFNSMHYKGVRTPSSSGTTAVTTHNTLSSFALEANASTNDEYIASSGHKISTSTTSPNTTATTTTTPTTFNRPIRPSDNKMNTSRSNKNTSRSSRTARNIVQRSQSIECFSSPTKTPIK